MEKKKAKDKNFSSEHFWLFGDQRHQTNLMFMVPGNGSLQLHLSKPKWQKFKAELVKLSAIK